MATYRITENDIKGMEVLATGYKAFKNDWTSKHGNYCYADENGEVLNSIHKVDGELIRCDNGLHFSRNPLDCFNYYESVQWNRFAKVEAYGELIDEGDKSIARILKIIKIYTFDEFINEIKEINNHITGGNDILGGNGIRGGDGIRGGNCIRGGSGIAGGNYIRGGSDICGGDDIRGGNCITGGYNIVGSSNIMGGSDIWGGCRIRGGNYIEGGNYILGGNDIHGGNGIRGGNDIWGARNCEGVSKCVFCYNFTGKLHAFNKPITEERFEEIWDNLNSFCWTPDFTNANKLRGDKEWEETNIPAIKDVSNKEAWSTMPDEMKEYIKSLPEFDEAIFKAITED